jgi:glycosyl hydrolase family 14
MAWMPSASTCGGATSRVPPTTQFDWSYYDQVFDLNTSKGLDLAPILAFHQAGGNVGDDYTSLLLS